MPLTEEQQAAIDEARADPQPTLRAVSPGMEAWMHAAIPVLDHGPTGNLSHPSVQAALAFRTI